MAKLAKVIPDIMRSVMLWKVRIKKFKSVFFISIGFDDEIKGNTPYEIQKVKA